MDTVSQFDPTATVTANTATVTDPNPKETAMLLTASRKDLKTALDTVKRAVPSRTQLPILRNVLLHADSDGLRIIGTDLEVGAEVRIPASVSRAGAITVSAADLAKAVARPGADVVSLREEATESPVLIVEVGSARLRLPSLPAEDYPDLPTLTPNIALEVPQEAFRSALRRVLPAVSKDETRPILCGVCVEMDRYHLRLATTDTHRLGIATLEMETGVLPDKNNGARQVVIPAAAMTLVDRFLTNAEGTLTVEIEIAVEKCGGGSTFVAGGHIRFTANGYSVVTKIIPGMFPRYTRVIPTGHTSHVALSAAPFLAALKAAAAVAKNSAAQGRVFLRCEENRLIVAATDSDGGRVEECLPADLEGDPIDVAYNGAYLIDAVSATGSPCVTLGLGPDALSPGALRSAAGPPNDFGNLTIIMPMQYENAPWEDREVAAAAVATEAAAVEAEAGAVQETGEATAERQAEAAWHDPIEEEYAAMQQEEAEAEAGPAEPETAEVLAAAVAEAGPVPPEATESDDPASIQPTPADAADPTGALEVLAELHADWAAQCTARGAALAASLAVARAQAMRQALAFLRAG